jgi:periodic tryptophan protein 1
VTAKTEDEISQLEIYVYDESEENLYIHHDLMLPNFPLCLEWLGFPLAPSSPSDGPPREFGNYVAVGTLDPEIEIWSLDVVEAIYPDAVLGRLDKSAEHVPVPAGTGKKKKKKYKRRAISDEYHVDAVLGLSWNKGQPNLLASASADRTVKVWDLTRHSVRTAEQQDEASEVEAMRSFNSLHTDKVQAVQWNPTEPNVLLTGSYDRTIRMVDLRAPDQCVGAVLGSDVEALRWDPWDPHTFYVGFFIEKNNLISILTIYGSIGERRKWTHLRF